MEWNMKFMNERKFQVVEYSDEDNEWNLSSKYKYMKMRKDDGS